MQISHIALLWLYHYANIAIVIGRGFSLWDICAYLLRHWYDIYFQRDTVSFCIEIGEMTYMRYREKASHASFLFLRYFIIFAAYAPFSAFAGHYADIAAEIIFIFAIALEFSVAIAISFRFLSVFASHYFRFRQISAYFIAFDIDWFLRWRFSHWCRH